MGMPRGHSNSNASQEFASQRLAPTFDQGGLGSMDPTALPFHGVDLLSIGQAMGPTALPFRGESSHSNVHQGELEPRPHSPPLPRGHVRASAQVGETGWTLHPSIPSTSPPPLVEPCSETCPLRVAAPNHGMDHPPTCTPIPCFIVHSIVIVLRSCS